MQKAVASVKAHFPLYVGGVLVALNALIDAGYLAIPAKPAGLISAVLTAAGFGALHVRSIKK